MGVGESNSVAGLHDRRITDQGPKVKRGAGPLTIFKRRKP